MKYSKKAKAIILACVIVILIAGIRLGSDIRYLQSWLVFGLPCAGLLIYSIAAARAYKARMLCGRIPPSFRHRKCQAVP